MFIFGAENEMYKVTSRLNLIDPEKGEEMRFAILALNYN